MPLPSISEVQRLPVAAPKRKPVPPLTYTLDDAVAASGMSRNTLYRHAEAGHLKLVKVGGKRLVDAASLRALVGVEE